VLPSSEYDRKVYIYALADATPLVRGADAITRFVCEVLKTPPSPTTRITIAPGSGWFEFTSTDELWARASPPALPEVDLAKKNADAVLTEIEKKCSDANPDWPKGLKGLALLPPVVNLKRSAPELVMRPDDSGPDHWLYRAEPQVVLDGAGRTRAGVFGAAVEVRIGHMGRVISVRSRWTPLSGEKILTALSPYAPPEDYHAAGEDHEEEGEDGPPLVNYVLEGDGAPQFYLAPYYFTVSGHDIDISSASRFSLTVDFARIGQNTRDLTLLALASGGSGAYLYNWASYSFLKLEKGVREIGRGDTVRIGNAAGGADASRITIPNTPCVLMLNVKDSQTGAFKHAQTQVFPSPWTDDGASAATMMA
jgi:hypothetical protein